jgi:signal peptidase I
MKRNWISAVTAGIVSLALLAVLSAYLFGAIPYHVYVVHTGSMSPTIPPGSAVLVRDGHYRTGEVIAFRERGEIVTHRLVSIRAGEISTKGDANTTIDPWQITSKNVVGGVVAAPHLLGFFLVYLRVPTGLVSILCAILLIWQTPGLARAFEPSVTPQPRRRVKSAS